MFKKYVVNTVRNNNNNNNNIKLNTSIAEIKHLLNPTLYDRR